jgi:integrase
MGVTVRQKEKGRGKPWWVFIAHNGERKSIKVGDRTAAEALAGKIQEKLKAGELQIAPEKKIPTFGEYARKWLDGYGETHLKYSTWKSYGLVLKNHLATFNDRPIDQITRAEIKEMIYEKLKSSLAPNSVKNIKNILSGILSHALEDGLLLANPVSRLGKLIKTKERKADVTPLTREEARDFLEAMAKHYPRYYPFFLCALRTGLRLGELLALEWGDIDFRGGFIEVRRAYTKGGISTPKNGRIRRVDMSRQLSETLQTLQTERKRESLARGWGELPELVFVNEAGRMINSFNLRPRAFHGALAKAGLRRIRIHDLRHTFASMLIQNGESLAYVKDQLGHGSISITVDTYGHLVSGANRGAVDKLDDDLLITYGQKSGCV